MVIARQRASLRARVCVFASLCVCARVCVGAEVVPLFEVSNGVQRCSRCLHANAAAELVDVGEEGKRPEPTYSYTHTHTRRQQPASSHFCWWRIGESAGSVDASLPYCRASGEQRAPKRRRCGKKTTTRFEMKRRQTDK